MDNNATPAKRHLLIITGPQGSGNHIFSRVFSWHPAVRGWSALQRNYWVPSDQEPLAEYWVWPERFDVDQEFGDKRYLVSNVSAPFFYDGVRQLPKIEGVIDRAVAAGVQVTVAIVTRDQAINMVQQQRVGGEITLMAAREYYHNLLERLKSQAVDVHFISHESLFHWRETYVNYLSGILRTPVDLENCLRDLDTQPNLKYVKPVETHWLDAEIRAGRRAFVDRVVDQLRDTPESP